MIGQDRGRADLPRPEAGISLPGVAMVKGDILIAVDAGTSVIKAVAFTLAGDALAVASRPNVYATPGPGQVEQDMSRTWADCVATLRELQLEIPDLARRAAGVAITGQGDGTWLIDAQGEPVGGGLLWLDFARGLDLRGLSADARVC